MIDSQLATVYQKKKKMNQKQENLERCAIHKSIPMSSSHKVNVSIFFHRLMEGIVDRNAEGKDSCLEERGEISEKINTGIDL